jgi:hypothetical protein
MLDDLLEHILEDSVWAERVPSARKQRIIRLVFGLFGAGLCFAGMIVTAMRIQTGNVGMLVGIYGMYGSIAWFCLNTVILGRSPRLAGWLLAGSFATLFLARVIFGP